MAEAPLDVRQLASIHFKNAVGKHWAPYKVGYETIRVNKEVVVVVVVVNISPSNPNPNPNPHFHP